MIVVIDAGNFKEYSKALNDDISLSLTVDQVAETRSPPDLRVDANMASREHYLQYGVRIFDWAI